VGKESPSSFCSEAAAHIFQTLLPVRVPLAFFGLPGCASPSSHWLDLYVTKQVPTPARPSSIPVRISCYVGACIVSQIVIYRDPCVSGAA